MLNKYIDSTYIMCVLTRALSLRRNTTILRMTRLGHWHPAPGSVNHYLQVQETRHLSFDSWHPSIIDVININHLYQSQSIRYIMALHHFKKDVINSSGSNNNDSSLFQPNISSSDNSVGSRSSPNSQSQYNCRNCQQRGGDNCVMLNRVNLGDVLRKTISEEMRSISMENGQNCLRFGGS